jgi:hypothetical protein
MTLKTNYILFICISQILAACRVITPLAPISETLNIPDLKQSNSSIEIPIIIDLMPYLAETEKAIPTSFIGKEENCSGVSYSYRFNRNPIKFEGKGDYLYYEVDGKYALTLNYCPECTSLFNEKGNCLIPRIYASCGVSEPMRRVLVAYTTNFKVTPDFRFKTSTELRKFETPDPCEISVFNYDATGKLRKEVLVVLKDIENDIDQKMAAIDIKTQIEEVWKALSIPTSLGKYGFFSIQPKGIALSDVTFQNNKANIDVNLTLQPLITTYPQELKIAPLPQLSNYKKTNGFNINVDIVATYDSLSSILSQELTGKKVQIKKNEVVFQEITIEGAANEQLSLKVNFTGRRKGTLYLLGTPTFDSISQVISFPDLTFNIATKNALLKSAKWLFSSKITTLLREYATFDLDQHLVEMKKTVQKELNREIREGIKLTGKIEKIELKEIYPREQHLIIRVNSVGVMNLSM